MHGLLIGLLLAAVSAPARAACEDPVPESEWSILMPLASESLMLDIGLAGADLVVVGERGHVLVSHDQGVTWEQQRTPTRTLLTAVWFHDRQLGWAVGHDAVILRTKDGGENWCRVHFAPELEFPLFDVWFADASNGFAVGAYGYFLRTSDGGTTWEEEMLELVEPEPVDEAGDEAGETEDYASGDGWDDDLPADLHMNRIVSDAEGRLFLMAEAGTVFRSDDDGYTWTALAPPYDGSFFGGVAPDDESLLVFGLRGNMFRTWDGGETWSAIRLPVDTSLFGGARLADGSVLVVGTAGVMLYSREGGSFSLHQRGDRKALMSAFGLDDGTVIVIGEPGVERLDRRAEGME